MKKLLMTLICLFLALTQLPTLTTTAQSLPAEETLKPTAVSRANLSSYQDILTAYTNTLQQQPLEYEGNTLINPIAARNYKNIADSLTYALIDINSDGSNELVLKLNDNIFEIFTTSQGAIVQLFNLPTLTENSLSLYKNGNILLQVKKDDQFIHTLFLLKKNGKELEEIASYSSNSDKTTYHQVDKPDKKYTLEEFNAALGLDKTTLIKLNDIKWETLPVKNTVQTPSAPVATQPIQQTAGDYKYSVNLNDYGSLIFDKVAINAPSLYEIQHSNRTINIGYMRGSSSTLLHHYEVKNIPTTEIRIFSDDRSGIRTVKVNTQLTITGTVSGEASQFTGDTFYLFHNRNGGISLITPNYAGNITPDQVDVQLEYIARGIGSTPQTQTSTYTPSSQYSVAIDDYSTLNFSRGGSHFASINVSSRTISFNHATYRIELMDVPTTELHINSANGPSRNIKANSYFYLSHLVNGSSDSYLESASYYLFYNRDGGISLVVGDTEYVSY